MPEPFAAWIERDVVRAHGPDTLTFLQGQLSQDIAEIDIGVSRWSLLLAPTGKVDAWLRVSRAGSDDFILDTDAGYGDAVAARLERFKLRTKCDLEPAERVKALAIRGTTIDHPDARPIVWPGTTGADVFADIEPPLPPGDDYEQARIIAGVPAMGHELTDATIPVEAGQWLIDASVSFTKGCYTGQELVARIDSRGGNAPRPVRGVRADDVINIGATITHDGKDIGRITSAAGTVALAPVPRAVTPGTEVRVDGSRAHVTDLPMPP